MKCSKCQAEVSDSAKFCPQCGFNLVETGALFQGCQKDVDQCESLLGQGKSSTEYIQDKVNERLSEWKLAAESGLAQAQWLLGRCYDEGLGVQMNKAEAFGWHLKAAEQGFARSQNHVAFCYQNADSVDQDQQQAAQWFRRAAKSGLAEAQSNLGWRYDTGSGVVKDESEAAKWYRKAAEQGDRVAQYNLGVHYEWGSGVTKNKEQAIDWYRKSAEQGYEKAAEALERLGAVSGQQQRQQSQPVMAEAEPQPTGETEDTEQQFRLVCRQSLADGKLMADEKHEIKKMAKSFGMSKHLVKQLFDEEKRVFLQNRKSKESKK